MNTPPAVDTIAFRNALGSFTTGVTVVTTRSQTEHDVGLTANSFNSVSLEPPMVLWSLGKSALSLADFESATYFAVHVLAEEQVEISNNFARRGADKFADIELERGPENIPLLKHCASRFICKTRYQYEGGDHIIFVGEVVEFSQYDAKPLLFHAGRYGQLHTPKVHAPNNNEDASLGYLLRQCSHSILGSLKSQLADRKLSVAQYYFLALLAKHGRKNFEEALQMAAQGDATPSNREIDELIGRNLLNVVNDDIEISDVGTQLHMELVAFYTAAEQSALSVLDYATQQSLKIALAQVSDAFKSK